MPQVAIIIEIELMIKKQQGTANKAGQEGEEVKVLAELAEVLEKQVSGVKEMKKKVERKRILERNPPKLASFMTRFAK